MYLKRPKEASHQSGSYLLMSGNVHPENLLSFSTKVGKEQIK